jgi:hypothetical protein
VAVRFLLAIAIACAVCELAWRVVVPSTLSLTTDIVGFPTFYNWNPYRYLDSYKIMAYLFPAVAIGAYLLIGLRGPLRTRERTKPMWPPRVADEVEEPTKAEPQAVRVFWRVGRLLLPGIVLALEIAVARSYAALTWSSLAPAAAYLAVVLLVGVAASLRQRRLDPTRVRTSITVANIFGALAVIPGAYLISRSTAVVVRNSHRIVYYYWFPLWLCIVLTAVAAGICLVAMLRSQFDLGALRRLEIAVLYVIVGSMLIFIGSASLPGAYGGFQGYDDAQSLAGAQMTFFHGLFPWRDIFLLHGPFYDDLQGALGMFVFGDSRWGANAGIAFLITPILFILFMAFVLYFARRNRLVAFGIGLAVMLGLIELGGISTRFALFYPLLIIFDQVLRRRSRVLCGVLILVAFLMVILTPEAILMLVGPFLAVVAFEAVHRHRGAPVGEAFFRTIWCLICGVVLVGLWLLFLAAEGALTGFVNYFRANANGHELWGAIPSQFTVGFNGATTQMLLPMALYLLTIWRIVWKIRSRSVWSTRDWALIASAAFIPLYYEGVLSRLDVSHVGLLWQAAVPLVVLWSIIALSFLDRTVVKFISRISQGGSMQLRHPVTAAAVLAVAFASPAALTTLSVIPADFHPVVAAPPPKAVPLLGYTIPGRVDTAQITDLGKVLDTYAPHGAPVFDFTNDLGVTYFLLNRLPGAPFYHVDAAQTGFAQRLEISALEKSRPPVVIFFDITYGLPNQDGILSEVRGYEISDYLLSHYRPLLDTDGQLILIRDDLYRHAPPPPHDLSSPPETSNLYAAAGTCNWGYTPNFLSTPASIIDARKVSLHVVPRSVPKNAINVQGWAMDGKADKPALAVVAVAGGKVIATAPRFVPRPDVVLASGKSQLGWTGFDFSFEDLGSQPWRLYAVNRDGTVTPIKGSPNDAPLSTAVSMGGTYPVRLGFEAGYVDSAVGTSGTQTWQVQLPKGMTPADYGWLEFRSSSALRNAAYTVSGPSALGAAPIEFQTLPRSGHRVFVEVGSCLAWHGVSSGTLSISGQGAPSSLTVSLVH